MKNFILFITAVLVLGFGGYFAYRMYRGESPKKIIEQFSGGDKPLNVHYHEGKQAYNKNDYKTALKKLSSAMEAHDSGDRYNQLTEKQREAIMFYVGICYLRLWEEGGKKDASLQADGLRILYRFLDEYPDARYTRRMASQAIRELRSEKLENDSEPPPDS
ncbi:hypothetical protein LCGC14_2896400 [marine sediment metagenome]|uniref:Uncharacterized protein n=1 Tax=marine sediment metagenome TaxID=412755 RepID=A0A0F9ALV1_9ZZZZ